MHECVVCVLRSPRYGIVQVKSSIFSNISYHVTVLEDLNLRKIAEGVCCVCVTIENVFNSVPLPPPHHWSHLALYCDSKILFYHHVTF